MNIEAISEIIRRSRGFEQTVGMEFISTPEPDTCMARLVVDRHVLQPFGYLSGGAILALAESLAGAGSSALCPDCSCAGISVTASHVHSAKDGETVTALAHLIHKGRQTHVWRIDVTDDSGRLVSTVNVTNLIRSL